MIILIIILRCAKVGDKVDDVKGWTERKKDCLKDSKGDYKKIVTSSHLSSSNVDFLNYLSSYRSCMCTINDRYSIYSIPSHPF